MKRILLLFVLVWINAAHADDLAPLVKSIGACRHLSVTRDVGPVDVPRVGQGFEYETSDQKMIARVLKFLETLPSRDTWIRFHGEGANPDANGVLWLEFKKSDGRKVDIFIYEPSALVFHWDQLFGNQGQRACQRLYPIIGKSASAGVRVTALRRPIVFDGTDDLHSRQRKVHDVQPVTREPLFDSDPVFQAPRGRPPGEGP